MKSILLYGFLFFLSASFAQAQHTSAWHTLLAEAQAEAQEKNAPILMVFSGSDWCKPCMLLKRDILEHPDFLSYAEQNLVLLLLDFPAKKKNKLSPELTTHHEALAEQYNAKGAFPMVLLLDAAGLEINRFSYQADLSPADYIQKLQTSTAP